MDAPVAAVRSRGVFRKLEKPIPTPMGRVGANAYVAVEIFTADGEYGICYIRTFELTIVRAAQMLVESFAEDLIGMPVSETFAAWKRMCRKTMIHGRAGVHAYAISALDTALWDLKAKLCGLPLYRLLGGARESVPSYYSGGFLSATNDELVREAEQVRQRGCEAFKMRIGRPSLREDLESARLLKEAFGGSLMADAAGGFDRTRAMQTAKEFAPLSPVWIEDPVPTDKIKDLQGSRSSSPVPFAGGELLYTEDEVTAFAERDAFDHILIDLQRIGGVTGWIRSAAIADHYGLRVSAHVFPEIAAHLLCGLDNGYFHESLDWSHELFANPPALKGGRAVPSEQPGLGLVFEQDFIRKYLVGEVVTGNAKVIPSRLA